MALSIEQVINQYKGQMVRFYTRDDAVVTGFLLGTWRGYFCAISLTDTKSMCLSKLPVNYVRHVIPAGLMEEKGKLCRFIYGSVN